MNKTFKGTPDENVNIAEKHLEQTLLKQPSNTSSLAKHQTLAVEFAPGNPGTREFPGIPTFFQSRRPGNFVAGIPGKF